MLHQRRLWIAGIIVLLSLAAITSQRDRNPLLAQGRSTATPNVNWIVSQGDILVWSGPDYTFTEIGTLSYGTWIQPVGRDVSGNWILISYLYTQGWIPQSSAQWRLNTNALPVIAPEAITPIPRPLYYNTPGGPTQTPNASWVRVAVDGAWVRSGPGQGYVPLGALFTGDVVDPVAHDRADDWVMIRYGDGYGWVRYDLVIWAEDVLALPVIDPPDLTPNFTSVPTGPAFPVNPTVTRPSRTPNPTATNTPTRTPSMTPSVTQTASATATATAEATAEATATATSSPTRTPSITPSDTLTASATATATAEATASATATATSSPTRTPSTTPSATATALPSNAPGSTTSSTRIASPTAVSTVTATVTAPATAVVIAAAPSETSAAAHKATVTATPTSTPSKTLAPTLTPTSTHEVVVSAVTPDDASSGDGVPIGYWLLGAGILAAAGYGSIYLLQASALRRARSGFLLTTCPVCEIGRLSPDVRRYRTLGIPRSRRVIRCDSCRSVLREVSPGEWRYAVDGAVNVDLFERFNGRVLSEDELRAISPEYRGIAYELFEDDGSST